VRHADETNRDREDATNELGSRAQNRVDGVEKFAMLTSACMGGEAESALMRPLGSRPMGHLSKSDMRRKGKEKCTLVSFSQNPGVDKGAFHGLKLSFSSL